MQGKAVIAAAAVALCLAASGAARADGDAPAAVAVTSLGPIRPENAPGQALYLLRYTIAPGTRLPLHHHEGTQIGLVASGELTYHVESGEVPVFRTDAAGKAALVRTVRPGETARISAGQWVVEEPEDRHWGANEGAEPLEIVTSALLRDGAPLATRD